MVTKPTRLRKSAARRSTAAKQRAYRVPKPRKGEHPHDYLVRLGESMPPELQAKLPTTDEFMRWRHGGREDKEMLTAILSSISGISQALQGA